MSVEGDGTADILDLIPNAVKSEDEALRFAYARGGLMRHDLRSPLHIATAHPQVSSCGRFFNRITSGTLSLFLIMDRGEKQSRRTGFVVRRHDVVVAAPDSAPRTAERRRRLRWCARGGRLVGHAGHLSLAQLRPRALVKAELLGLPRRFEA